MRVRAKGTGRPDRWRAFFVELYPHEVGHVRWLVVTALAVALIGLGDLCLAQITRPPRLGVEATGNGTQLLVHWVQPGTLAWDAGIRPGDDVVAIDNRAVLPTDNTDTVARASTLEVRTPSGAPVVARADAALVALAPLLKSFPAIAIAFFGVGGIVFVVANDVLTGGIILAFATSSAVMLLAALIAPFGAAWALALEYASFLGFGAGTFLVFLVFPVNRLGVPSRRRFALGFLVAHGALLVLYLFAVAFDTGLYPATQVGAFGALALDVLGAGALAVRALTKPPPVARQARFALGFIAIGLLLGVAPFGVLSLGPSLLGLGEIVRPDVAVLSMICLPLSLGVAVLGRQFLGISRIVRRNLIALLVWGALLATYGVVFDVLALRLGVTEGHPARWLGVMLLGIGLVVETFPLAQHRLRYALERMLFRDVYDYPETLHALGARIVRLAGLEEIARLVLGEVGTTLDVAWLAIEIGDEEGGHERFTWGDFPERGWETMEAADLAVADLYPLIADGARIGSLVVGPKRHDDGLRPEDDQLLQTLAHVLAPALRNALLIRRLEHQVAMLGAREGELAALSAELIRVQEDERRRLALDLHDDPLQRATLLARELGDRDDIPAAGRWRESVDEIAIALRSICMGLRPPFLDDFGLAGGLEWLVHDVSARSHLAVRLSIPAESGRRFGRLPSELETALFRVAQEALANCQKHARASQVTVVLEREARVVRLLISDDGRGPTDPEGREDCPSLGIIGMRERLRSLGGAVTVQGRPEGGTIVTAEVDLGRRSDSGESVIPSD